MSLSRTPSPNDRSSTANPNRSSKSKYAPSDGEKSYGDLNGSFRDANWRAARARAARVNGYGSYDSRRQGSFFNNSLVRSLSASLPRFNHPPGKEYSSKGRLAQNKYFLMFQRLLILIARLAWRLRLPLTILFCFIMSIVLFYVTPLHYHYKRSWYMGGGKKFVLILAANPGGGVMEWKGPREWAVERDSVRNKRNYVKRWGYNLEIVDMATKKRYAHEWRESWEKADTIRRCMNEYPDAEWFWWLDLNTFIMEPTISLQKQLFNNLEKIIYRDINIYNPLALQHPPPHQYLDDISKSATGDGKESSVNLLIAQDCSGFTLGSFFMRRSAWSDRLLDMWWDPVHYEQKHMQWEHKEQDALEYLYTNHPWIRSGTAFVPQRKMSSFPPGACGQGGNETIHYHEKDRDFMVSMAGCEWGRDCWAEIYFYRQLSNKLNRNPWEKFKDGLSDGFRAIGRLFKRKSDKEKEKEKEAAKAREQEKEREKEKEEDENRSEGDD